MYNTRLRSELLDSLDFLIPPVKKLPRAFYNDSQYNDVTLTAPLLRDCHRTVFANRKHFLSKTSESDLQTCSSLILKKTTKQLIHEQYSILNLSTCNREPVCIQNRSRQRIFHSNEEKPTIKVTVIPKVKETQTSKVFRNRCRYHKKVQSTVSNQDNSIKNQNVYFLLKRRKREKVHELKLSESDKLSDKNINHKYGDISIEQITESRQIINSLNMDKRKRKDNKNKKALKTNISDDHDSPTRYRDKFSNANDRKSRVSIVGELGLTQDDRYVLKCAAAVNDKPIETTFLNDDENPMRLIKNHNFHQNSSQHRPTACNVNNCEALRQFRQQNCNEQTNITNPYYLRNTVSNNRVASQSTQVNFNSPNQTTIKKFRNQIAQCNCNLSTTEELLDTEAGGKVVKKCKSPLVIISVYPRPDKGTDENDTVKIIQRQTSPERKEINVMRSNITGEKFKQLNSGKYNTNKKVETKLPRSQSPSPKTKIGSKKYIENKIDSRGKNNNSMKNSGPSVIRSNKSYIINNLQEHTSCHCNDKKFLQSEYFNRQQNKTIKDKSKDTEEVKKALVNSFLRNVNVIDKDNKNSKKFRPKEDASKVTININGEKDNYDVLLQHSCYDTGISVKQTRKVRPFESFSSEEEVNTKSLENFLLVSHERMKKNEFNQEAERSQPPDVLKIKPTDSRINVKDSIEICRRQGEHSNYHLKPRSKHYKNDFADTVLNSDSYAQVKHYRGDDCSLSDPNERDREIRELLGIMRCHRLEDTEQTESRKTKERGCCCNRKCSAGLMTGISISKFFTSKCFKRKTKKADMQNETTQIGSPGVVEETKEKTEPSQKDKRKSNISKKTKVTVKSEDKHVSESPEPIKTSEEATTETTETTEDDSSKEQEHIDHIEHDEVTHDKRHSHGEKRISKETTKGQSPGHGKETRISKTTTKKEPSKENRPSKGTTQKEHSEKSNHHSTVHGPQDDKINAQNLILNRNIQIFLQVEQFNKQKPVVLTRQQYDKVKRIIECTISKKLSIQKRKRCSLKNCNVVSIGEIKVKPQLQLPLRFDRALQTDRTKNNNEADFIMDKFKAKKTRAHHTKRMKNKKIDRHIDTHIMAAEKHNIEQVYPRQAVSSMEIRYASVEYKKRVIISSSTTRFKNDIIHSLHTSNVGRNSNSIHTIFKGHKRSATPNLGTSACSLFSNVTDFSNKSFKQPQCAGDFKPKKPFLQRLISCLVMRSTQTSNIKDAAKKRKVPSVDSSMDSYHISTSLGALDMSSSLYDTTASFYSNHTIMPVNKIKRGFFSSVRGFLTSRRS